MPISANIMHLISITYLILKSHLFFITVLANLIVEYNDSSFDKSISLKKIILLFY